MKKKGHQKGFTIFIVLALVLILFLSPLASSAALGSIFGSHAREGTPPEGGSYNGETGPEEDVIATGPCSADQIKSTPMQTNQASVTVPIWQYISPGNKTSSSKTLTVHANCVETIKKIFQEIYDDPSQPAISTGDTACYAPRGCRDSGFCSNHNWGIACDINWSENWCYNCYGTTGNNIGNFWKPGNVVPDKNREGWVPGLDERSIPINGVIANILKQNGWGRGLYRSFNDFMHFSADNGH